jgi:SAM-dependent methyltransferase
MTTSDIRGIHQKNGVWWDETAAWYGAQDEEADVGFLRSGGSYLFENERALLGDLHPWCGRAIHLQCSHGRDALSLINDGAAEVVGIDISARLLAVARRKAAALSAPATFVQSDILDTPADLDGTADLVYTGKGALCWMMDLDAWAGVVARLLKPGGRLFLYEGHPLDWVWDTEAPDYRLDTDYGSYFAEHFRDRLFSKPTQSRPTYRHWPLADIVNSLIDAGLTIDRLGEYPEPFWGQFPHMTEETTLRLPHTFAILATKRR